MRVCWNRQTGTFEGRVLYNVWVQVPLLAPKGVFLNLPYMWTDGWAGLRRTTGTRVYVNSVSRVRIPLCPLKIADCSVCCSRLFCCLNSYYDTNYDTGTQKIPILKRNQSPIQKRTEDWFSRKLFGDKPRLIMIHHYWCKVKAKSYNKCRKKELPSAVKCSPFVRQCGIIEIYQFEI